VFAVIGQVALAGPALLGVVAALAAGQSTLSAAGGQMRRRR
jgi:hypothetical protein